MPIKERWAADRGEREREGGGRERERRAVEGREGTRGRDEESERGVSWRGVSEYICSPSTYEEYGRQRQAEKSKHIEYTE